MCNGLAAGMKYPKPWFSPAEEAQSDFSDTISEEEHAEIEALIHGPAMIAARSGLQLGTPMMRGKDLIINQHNAILFLARNVDSVLPDLRHNEMTGRNEWRDGPVNDPVLMLAYAALNRLGMANVGKEMVKDALRVRLGIV